MTEQVQGNADTGGVDPSGQVPGGNSNGSEPPAGDVATPDARGAGESGGVELPESYDFSLGEGFELTEEDSAAYAELFRGWGLTQDQVNQLSELESGLGQRLQEQASEQLQQTMDGWLEAAKKDPEIGGENWEKSLHLAAHAMEKVGADEDFVNLMDTTGLGSHPVVVKAFATLGKLLGDDTFEPGSASDDSAPSYRSWYADTTPESKKG